MKKISLVLVIVILLSTFSFLATDEIKGYPPETTRVITADAVYLKNLDTGNVVYEKNADMLLPPASLTKIMTAILALENTDNIKEEMVVYPPEVQDYLYTYQMKHGAISNGRLIAGEEMPMEDYLYAIMLPSANEGAMSIAQHIGGSQEGFLEMMNQRAIELGAENTHFVNPTGLYDKAHLSTAKDLAILAEHAMTYDVFQEIASTYSYTTGPTNKHDSLTWYSTIEMQNPRSSYYYPNLKGVKTGTLPQSGRNFISTASMDGFNYMLVLLGCDLKTDANGDIIDTEQKAFLEAAAIYNWVFTSFRNKTIIKQGEIVGEIPITLSKEANFVHLVTEENFTTLIPDSITMGEPDSQLQTEIITPESLEAPIKRGDYIGDLIITLSGEEIGEVRLLASDNVKASTLLKAVNIVKTAGSSFWFKFIVVLGLLIFVVYILLLLNKNKHKQNRKNSNHRSGPNGN